MSDIYFSCPHCQNPLVVEAEGAGQDIPCPLCEQEITIPEVSEERPEPAAAPAQAPLLPGLDMTEEDLDRLAADILRRAGAGDSTSGARVIKREDGERDIAFTCHSCQTPLVVDFDGAGLEIECPSCAVALTIPDPVNDAEAFFANALASRLASLRSAEAPATEPPPTPPVAAAPSAPTEEAPREISEGVTRTRIPLRPKMRTRKPGAPAVNTPNLPFLMPPGAVGEDGLPVGMSPEDIARATSGAPGSGYVIVPIQTPNGPAAMITAAPQPAGESAGNRKRPRYPQKYSELAAKLRSVAPTGDANPLQELEKRGPLVSRLLAQHFIEKALEETGEIVPETHAQETVPGTAHKGALKSPRRLELPGTEAAARRLTGPLPAGPAQTVALAKPAGTLPPNRQHQAHGRSHRHSGGSDRKRLFLTLFAVVAGITTLAALLYNASIDGEMERVGVVRQGDGMLLPPKDAKENQETPVVLPQLEQNTASASVAVYCQATDWRELLKLVRQPERVGPLMEKYYAENALNPIQIEESRLTQSAYLGQRLIVRYSVTSQDNYQEIPFLLERSESGAYLVDWEYVVEYNSVTWEQYRQQKPTEPQEFRVRLSLADYYNFEFADSRIYQAFKIQGRETGFVGIYAFVKRDSDAYRAIEQFMRPEEPMDCMLNLVFPADAKSDSLVEITDFIRYGWVVP